MKRRRILSQCVRERERTWVEDAVSAHFRNPLLFSFPKPSLFEKKWPGTRLREMSVTKSLKWLLFPFSQQPKFIWSFLSSLLCILVREKKKHNSKRKEKENDWKTKKFWREKHQLAFEKKRIFWGEKHQLDFERKKKNKEILMEKHQLHFEKKRTRKIWGEKTLIRFWGKKKLY